MFAYPRCCERRGELVRKLDHKRSFVGQIVHYSVYSACLQPIKESFSVELPRVKTTDCQRW